MTANFATVLGVENVSRPLDQTLITAAPTSASSELPVAIEIAGPIEPVVLALAIIAPRNMVVDNTRASSVDGTSRPSALAVLRLIARLYLVAAWTGRSAGFSPLRISDRHRHQPDDGCRSGLFRCSSGPRTATNSRNW